PLASTPIPTVLWSPRAPARPGHAWRESARRHGDYALVGVAAAVTLRDESIAEARLALTGVGGRPTRARDAERRLVGRRSSDAVLEDAAEAVRQTIQPASDIHGTAEYRRRLASTLTVRALRLAMARPHQ